MMKEMELHEEKRLGFKTQQVEKRKEKKQEEENKAEEERKERRGIKDQG